MSRKEIEEPEDETSAIEGDFVMWEKEKNEFGFGRVYSALGGKSSRMVVIENGNHKDRAIMVKRSEARVLLSTNKDLEIH